MSERQRLHIAPLTPDSLPTILSQQLQQQATNISFHSIQTFPERSYAYVDLPAAEAQKLRRKFHGCLFRGQKMTVEVARPEKKLTLDTAGGGDKQEGRHASSNKGEVDSSKRSLRSKGKQKRTDKVISGVELPAPRKVKRGWTESAEDSKESARASKQRKHGKDSNMKKKDKASAKKAQAASITGQSECLFKSRIPPNARDLPDEKGTQGKSRKRKHGDAGTTVVHEFEHATRFPKFLKDTAVSKSDNAKGEAQFVEGKGWVDDDGHVVEAAPAGRPRRRSSNRQAAEQAKAALGSPRKAKAAAKEVAVQDDDDETSSSGSSSAAEEEDTVVPQTTGIASGRPRRQSGTNSSAPAFKNKEKGAKAQSKKDKQDTKAPLPTPSPISDDDASASQPAPAAAEVHPLEALFKRPQMAASQTNTAQQTRAKNGTLKSRRSKPNLEVSIDTSHTNGQTSSQAETFRFFDTTNTDPSNSAHQPHSSSTTGTTSSSENNIQQTDLTIPMMPQTPFTQQDYRHRRQRSAAPTPDTAMLTDRHFSFFPGGGTSSNGARTGSHTPRSSIAGLYMGQDDDHHDDEDGDGDEGARNNKNNNNNNRTGRGGTRGVSVTSAPDGDTERQGSVARSAREDSEFTKWFYANRSENNRAWKGRRREALKAARQEARSEAEATSTETRRARRRK